MNAEPDLATQIHILEAKLRRLRLEAVDKLVHALVDAVAGTVFSSCDVWRHAQLASPALRRALETMSIRNARQLGKWLQQLQGRDVGGLVLERIGDDYLGAVWMFRESPTHSG
jgi:hypothetical protein